ncbi:hypothetical protein [Leptospira bandrabouensis]|uniref:Uncharacterized protein n=1 Tax=Leptospira bandrabouensis TaxID=2484903 RepID=A0A6H3NN86_9LEPT|nr:hypothetical protein [Leptospira bandrabouensis]TGN07449.1 hypothetical protein EHR07_04825 [Leptospira bandrabouensis]TGN12806.1 hypothetical protein EHR08_15780 [Leptospira bandrabouensis]
MQASVSHQFVYGQSYRRQDQLPSPDDFPRYTEFSSITKVSVEKAKSVRVSNPIFMVSTFRSKLAVRTGVQLAMFLANENIEQVFNDSFQKLLDPNLGAYAITLNPGEEFPNIIKPEVVQSQEPFIVCYNTIPEFADFPTNSINNRLEAKTSKIVLDNNQKRNLVSIHQIQSATFSTNSDIVVENTDGFEFLYLVPYIDLLQRTEITLSGRINFMLEYAR